MPNATSYLTNEELQNEEYQYDCGRVTIEEDKTAGTIELLFKYIEHKILSFKLKVIYRERRKKVLITLEDYYPPKPYQNICKDILKELRRLEKPNKVKRPKGESPTKRTVELPKIMRFTPKKT